MSSSENNNEFRKLLADFLSNTDGATAVEYALIISTLSITTIGGLSLAFDSIEWLFADNNSEINQALKNP